MKSYEKLINSINKSGSRLCVGLDTTAAKLPGKLKGDPNRIVEFNRNVIDATAEFAAAYKINFAFYEQYGVSGMRMLEETIKEIPEGIFIVADAKRGDIGNTSEAYAVSAFEHFGADSVTVSPYMGVDSVEPFLKFPSKMVFVLALTSNVGSKDFQRLEFGGKPLFMHVIEKSRSWAEDDTVGFVVGATHPDDLKLIRAAAPMNALLIPGVGTQGGDAEATIAANGKAPAIINVSRDIIFAGNDANYASAIHAKAEYYHKLLAVR